jgi:hypothetical protein
MDKDNSVTQFTQLAIAQDADQVDLFGLLEVCRPISWPLTRRLILSRRLSPPSRSATGRSLIS